jgi:hypothetical protein
MKNAANANIATLRFHPLRNDSMPFGYGPRIKSLLNLSLACIELSSPGEFQLKTGQIIRELASHPEGLSKNEIAKLLYSDFDKASALRQQSLLSSVEKLIQRSRKKYRQYGLDIRCSRALGKFVAVPSALGDFCSL